MTNNKHPEQSIFSDLVTVEIRYHNPQTEHVQLVWGINGWKPVPEEIRPYRTLPGEKGAMNTPMTLENGVHVARIKTPRGARIDYGFRTDNAWETLTHQDSVVKIWFGERPLHGDFYYWVRLKTDRLLKMIRKSSRFGRKNWSRKKYRRFIILGQGRTGSSYLLTLLNSHPNIQTYNELYHSDETERIKHSPLTGPIMPSDNSINFLENRVFIDHPQKIKAVGFKIFYGHARIHWKETWDYLRDSQVSVIHLKRRNYLDRYLSEQLAIRSNQWSSLQKRKNLDYNEPVVLDPDECLKGIQRYARAQKQADHFFVQNPKIELYYEDLVNDRQGECNKILDFLGLERYELSAPQKRQRTKSKTQVIANYHELKGQFMQYLENGSCQQEWLDFFNE